MEMSPWGAAISLSYSRISQYFMEPRGSFCVHKSPPLVYIMSQMIRVHNTPSYLSKINFNIILPPRLSLSSGLFPSGLPADHYHIVLQEQFPPFVQSRVVSFEEICLLQDWA
jgi:hypothetical protein